MTEKRFRDRFDVIVDCNGNTDLIDRTNKFSTLPLGFDLKDLSSDEIGKLREWVDFLNGKENYNNKIKEKELIE